MPITNLPIEPPIGFRLRLGDKVPTRSGDKERPRSLDVFRVTTPSREVIEAFVNVYGGKAEEWEHAGGKIWQATLDSNAITVDFPSGEAVTRDMELWGSNGEMLRRCDGVAQAETGEACACRNIDPRNRANRCKPRTRLIVQAPDTGLLGYGKLETNSEIAAKQLPWSVNEYLARRADGWPIKARLVIDRQTNGRGSDYSVPTIVLVQDPDAANRAPLPPVPVGTAFAELSTVVEPELIPEPAATQAQPAQAQPAQADRGVAAFMADAPGVRSRAAGAERPSSSLNAALDEIVAADFEPETAHVSNPTLTDTGHVSLFGDEPASPAAEHNPRPTVSRPAREGGTAPVATPGPLMADLNDLYADPDDEVPGIIEALEIDLAEPSPAPAPPLLTVVPNDAPEPTRTQAPAAQSQSAQSQSAQSRSRAAAATNSAGNNPLGRARPAEGELDPAIVAKVAQRIERTIKNCGVDRDRADRAVQQEFSLNLDQIAHYPEKFLAVTRLVGSLAE